MHSGKNNLNFDNNGSLEQKASKLHIQNKSGSQICNIFWNSILFCVAEGSYKSVQKYHFEFPCTAGK
jgi:hypothetical protein